MLCNLCCLKTRLRLLCNKYQRHSSLNLVSQQLKLCNIFIFGMAYSGLHISRKDRKQMSATRFVSFPLCLALRTAVIIADTRISLEIFTIDTLTAFKAVRVFNNLKAHPKQKQEGAVHGREI